MGGSNQPASERAAVTAIGTAGSDVSMHALAYRVLNSQGRIAIFISSSIATHRERRQIPHGRTETANHNVSKRCCKDRGQCRCLAL